MSIACLARQIASSFLTQGESPQVSLSEAKRLIMFVKANRLASSLIITLIAQGHYHRPRRIAFDIFGKVNLRTRLEHWIFRKANLLTQGESPQVSLGEANRLIMFVKANRLESSLIITSLARRFALIFSLHFWVHRTLTILSFEGDDESWAMRIALGPRWDRRQSPRARSDRRRC